MPEVTVVKGTIASYLDYVHRKIVLGCMPCCRVVAFSTSEGV